MAQLQQSQSSSDNDNDQIPCPHCQRMHLPHTATVTATAQQPSAIEPVSVLDLRSHTSFSLKNVVAHGLRDHQPLVVPGNSQNDRNFAYSRVIDTLCLYSDKGLDIYEQITKLDEYYPFPAELEILIKYGDEIACRMFGLPAPPPSLVLDDAYLQGQGQGQDRGQGAPPSQRPSSSPAANGGAPKEKWGDFAVGTNNGGVNGGLSMDSARVGIAVELGSGSLEKTRHLLRSLSKLIQSPTAPTSTFSSIEYKALDLEHKSLDTTLSKLLQQESSTVTPTPDGTPRVVASGICATYDEGLAHLSSQAQSSDAKVSKSLLWLGSSIGNFSRPDAASFLTNIVKNVLNEGDTMLIGIDNCADGKRIETAYDDPQGVTRQFILEGVDNAGRALHGVLDGQGGLAAKNFDYVSRWNAELGRHEAYVKCKVDNLEIPLPASDNAPACTITLKKNEMVAIEVSYKYTQLEARALFDAAGLRLIQQWRDSRRLHSLYLVEKPSFYFPLIRSLGKAPKENAYGLPSIAEWEQLWKLWDNITMGIIPREILMTKPIPLRHIILFYTGHIPAFAGIHLSRIFKEPLIEPAYFAEIFERGIDPDVADPTKISHSHSIVPTKEDDWPSIDSILKYQDRVRDRIRKVYKEDGGKMTRRLARVMAMIFEHEAMHAETLVYIALQAPRLNPAPGRAIPDFPSLSRAWDLDVAADGTARDATLQFPSSTISIGWNDDDRLDATEAYSSEHGFGWDVENPERKVDVAAFKISATPVSNLQYRDWLSSLPSNEFNAELIPSSWNVGSSGKIEASNLAIKTLYGLVPFEFGKHWPVTGSAAQLGSFAAAKGGRLPSHGELAVFFKSNPPDSAAGNIGLTNLHPVPAVIPHEQRNGTVGFGSDGGVWMWSKDLLVAHEGYTPSEIYPGYSSDFHDNTHQLVLGGSYATPPRLARPTFVNWYQTKYNYVVAGARVAFD